MGSTAASTAKIATYLSGIDRIKCQTVELLQLGFHTRLLELFHGLLELFNR
jgi:hypothetical protein